MPGEMERWHRGETERFPGHGGMRPQGDFGRTITMALWGAGPVLAVYGWLTGRFGIAVLGACVLVAQWINRAHMARVDARPKLVLVALVAGITFGVLRPEVPEAIGKSVHQAWTVTKAAVTTPTDQAP